MVIYDIAVQSQIINVIAFNATWFSIRGFVKAPIIYRDEKTAAEVL